MMNIQINHPKEYQVIIEKGVMDNIEHELRQVYKGQNIAIITDTNVYKLYGEKLRSKLEKDYKLEMIIVEPGEGSKSFESLMEVYSKLSKSIKRNDLIVSFGGGLVGDLAGFSASTYMRGVKLIHIPTSLLSQVDSSIGGKTAINLPEGKNLVGTFYHPERVIIDPLLLKSLPDKYIKDGLGEVIKYACIKSKSLFNQLMETQNIFDNIEELIYSCLSIKKSLVEEDEKDQGSRMLLNFGHTIGHGIERHLNYSISHGEAVSLGIYHITKNSQKLGLTKAGSLEKLTSLLDKFNIKRDLPLSNSNIIKYIQLDKKNESHWINLILLKEIGTGFIHRVPLENILDYVNLE